MGRHAAVLVLEGLDHVEVQVCGSQQAADDASEKCEAQSSAHVADLVCRAVRSHAGADNEDDPVEEEKRIVR